MLGILKAFTIKILGAATGLGITLVITRNLSIESASEIFLVFSICSISTSIIKAGVETTVARLSNEHNCEEANKQIANKVTKIIVTNSLAFSILATILWVTIDPTKDYPSSRISTLLTIIAICFFDSLVACRARIIQGNGYPNLFLFVSLTQKFFVLPCIASLAWTEQLSNVTFYKTYILCYLVSLIALHYSTQQTKPRSEGKTTGTTISAKEILKESKHPLVVSIFASISAHSAVPILAYFSTTESVTDYSICIRISSVIGFLPVAANTIAAPLIASAYKTGGILNAQKCYFSFTKKLTTISVPLLALTLLLTDEILSVFGPEYSKASTALSIMLIGQLINVTTGTTSSAYYMTQNGSKYKRIYTTTSILSLLSLAPLSYYLSTTGAAISYTTFLASTNIIAFIHFARIKTNEQGHHRD